MRGAGQTAVGFCVEERSYKYTLGIGLPTVKLFLFLLTLVYTVALAATEGGADANPFVNQKRLTPGNEIDELVFGRLQRLAIQPALICSDAVFVRRAYLDVIGTLPTRKEARRFIEDRNKGKRSELIGYLLEQEEFADYWAMKWGDLLRVKAEFPINLWPNGAQAYHRWIRTSIKENRPYDWFVREMLTASGSNFRVPQVNFYRAAQSTDPAAIARAVALTFMGERTDNWPEEKLAGMSVFFSQISYKPTREWKEEIVGRNLSRAPGNEEKTAIFPDGTSVRLSPVKDPRAVFADWLVNPANHRFNRNIVNRIWSWLLGRGIIDEPDDIRPDNPPSNSELLVWLEEELVRVGYDLKHIYRLILNSKTYQLSSIARTNHPRAEANFARYPIRRLDAEVLIDALNQITGSTEGYVSDIPEPFTYMPQDQRSIALADGSITSPFLELFGRPSRDTGLESERNNRFTAAQRLHLLNSSHIQRKLEQCKDFQYLTRSRKGRQVEGVNALYLTILSRFPTPEEAGTALEYAKAKGISRKGITDLAWALVNTAEFLHRH